MAGGGVVTEGGSVVSEVVKSSNDDLCQKLLAFAS